MNPGGAPPAGDAAASALLRSPHAAALLSFHRLPTRWLHPSRWPAWLPPGWAAPADDDAPRHRHLSALILQRLGPHADALVDPDHAAWPLALAPAATLSTLMQRLAAVLAQRRLRHAIRRDDAAAVAAALDAATLAWARQHAAALGDADETLDVVPLPVLLAQWPQLGAAALLHAVEDAPAALRERLRLRTPLTEARPEHPLRAARADLALARRVLTDLDPRWMSSFPASP